MERREEYLLPNGTFSPHRHDAVLVTADQVLAVACKASPRIPGCYFLATARHETNLAINERDTEPDGTVTDGIFQLEEVELQLVMGIPNANPFDLGDAVKVFAALQERRLDRILKLAPHAAPPDVWAYLSISHNQGEGAVADTIKAHGLDWVAYKDRNLKAALMRLGSASNPAEYEAATKKLAWWRSVFAYGDDCSKGG